MPTKKGKILIVDDNVQILNSLRILLKNEYEEIETIKNPNLIPEKIRSNTYDIILLDMNFAAGINTGNEGIFWLREILKLDPDAIVILITAYGDINLAVQSIKEGATDFTTKPWDTEKLLTTLSTAYELRQSKLEVNSLKNKQKQLTEDIDKHFQMFTGTSKAMQEVQQTINKVAHTNANVLILGENGTGKELIAREIHKKSKRSAEVFVSVDMGALTETLFESEIFGHVKGAFTDAKEDKAGRFEIASGGTLFLDEIGNISMSGQSKLLSVIQNRQIARVGSNKLIPIDIRLISATNKPIYNMVEENLFREDLLYRINTIQIEVPPLRKRKDDIPGFVGYFFKQFTEKYEKPLLKITSDAYALLTNYSWPGNVRELKHTVEKAVILSESDVLKPEDFYLRQLKPDDDKNADSLKLVDAEKYTIEKVLEKCNGNLSKAAKMLEISRTTLYAKIEKYKIK
jgi:two-component system response regulator HydG